MILSPSLLKHRLTISAYAQRDAMISTPEAGGGGSGGA
jgi:hypothetical protein